MTTREKLVEVVRAQRFVVSEAIMRGEPADADTYPTAIADAIIAAFPMLGEALTDGLRVAVARLREVAEEDFGPTAPIRKDFALVYAAVEQLDAGRIANAQLAVDYAELTDECNALRKGLFAWQETAKDLITQLDAANDTIKMLQQACETEKAKQLPLAEAALSLASRLTDTNKALEAVTAERDRYKAATKMFVEAAEGEHGKEWQSDAECPLCAALAKWREMEGQG